METSKTLKRIWLNDTGVFEIIPNPGGGNCLFSAIAEALGHPEEHQRVREAIVNHLTRSTSKSKKLWKSMQPSLSDFWKHSSKIPENSETSSPETTRNEESTCCGFRKPRKEPCSFKRIYRQVMSQPGEPGTVFELRAAAHLYRFHFDYLDTVSPESSTHSTSASLSEDADSIDNGKDDGLVVCRGTMYQFHSCRNNGCKVPWEVPASMDDSQTDLFPWIDRRRLYLLHTRYSGFEGHWELLKPVQLRQFPMPLHQKIYGVVYPCPAVMDFEEPFSLDGFAIQLEAQVKSDPLMLPPEDPDWPTHDGDNFAGCLSDINHLITRATTSTKSTKGWRKLHGILSWTSIPLRFCQRNNKVGDACSLSTE